MRPERSLAWLIFIATGCDAGRGVPRLVPAPPLPATGVVIDLGSPARVVDANSADRPERGYTELGNEGGWWLAPGLPQMRVDPAHSATRLGPDRWLGDAVVIDLRAKVQQDFGALFELADLEAFESEHGVVRATDIVVLATGYDRLVAESVASSSAYSAPAISPGISIEVMRTLVVERGVRRIATDAPSVSPATDADRSAERLLLNNGGFVVVGLSGLERLPTRGATLVLAPLDLAGSTRAPLRALAVVPRR